MRLRALCSSFCRLQGDPACLQVKPSADPGLVNRDIPLARALPGAGIRQERYVALPMGNVT